MKPVLILIWAALLAGMMAASPGSARAVSAIGILRSVQPAVRWKAKTAMTGDFTCDGREDTAMIGFGRRGEPWIGLVPGSAGHRASVPSTLKFRLGNGYQDALCATPVRIETSPLVCLDPQTRLMPGCKPLPGCLALSMIDGKCDAVHFYWDADEPMLRWWRH